MNLRQVWTEIFQKPAGRLFLFLGVMGIFLTFILINRNSQPKIENKPSATPTPATQAKGSSYRENIPIPSPARATPTPIPVPLASPTPAVAAKPPQPIPQTIFATKEVSISEWYLPYGRMIRCELVNTVDSSNLDTPIVGLVVEDAWQGGRLIVPAGTEVHGVAQKSPVRDRVGSDRQWFLVFQDGRELNIAGTVLDYAPDGLHADSWEDSDGSAGLKGFLVQSDKYAEAKAILAAMISSGAGAFAPNTNIISPLTGGVTQVQNGGMQDALSAGLQAGAQIYSQRLLQSLNQNAAYVRVPSGTTFYLYITQTVDLSKASVGLSLNSQSRPKP